jgi:hypothetical protein
MRYLIPFLVIVLVFTACAPPDFLNKTQVDALISQALSPIKSDMDALKRSVDASNSRINNYYSKDEAQNIFVKKTDSTGGVNAYTKSESDNMYASKASITDLQTQLNTLKERVLKLETSQSSTPSNPYQPSSGYSGGTSNGVEVTFTPVPPPFWGGTSSQTLNFTVTATNKSSSFKYVRLSALITSLQGQAVNVETVTMTFNAPYVSGDIACPLTAYPSLSACTQFQGAWSGQAQPIGPSQSAYIYGHFTIKHVSGGTMWNFTITPIATDYQ